MLKNNHRIKKIILIAAFVMAAAQLMLLSGCAEIKVTHPLGNDKLLEINDTGCTMGTARARLLEAKLEYENAEDSVLWTRTIGDITLAQYVKNTVEDEMKKYTSAQVMSRDLTVFISDEERKAAEDDASKLLEELGQRCLLIEIDLRLKKNCEAVIRTTMETFGKIRKIAMGDLVFEDGQRIPVENVVDVRDEKP